MSKKERLLCGKKKTLVNNRSLGQTNYGKTDRKVKEDMDINDFKDKKGKGSGSMMPYYKVKSRYSVWLSKDGSYWSSVVRLVPTGVTQPKKKMEGFMTSQN